MGLSLRGRLMRSGRAGSCRSESEGGDGIGWRIVVGRGLGRVQLCFRCGGQLLRLLKLRGEGEGRGGRGRRLSLRGCRFVRRLDFLPPKSMNEGRPYLSSGRVLGSDRMLVDLTVL